MTRSLEIHRRYDEIPTDEEWNEIENIANCLTSIKMATKILCGVEYPTANFALLFRL